MMTTLAYTHLYTKEEELATLRTQNAELLRKLQRKIRPVQQLAPTLSTWKPGSLHAMSSDAPSFTESKDILRVRKFTLDWPGYYSFVLRLGKEERQMITSKEIVNHEKRHQEFRDTYTTPSIQQPTTTFRTGTDSHIFNVFRNAPITLRILIMCESYPFFLCLYLYSTYVLTLHILLLCPHFGFDMLFVLICTVMRAAGGF
jgi:hypothetical protein